MSKFDAISDKLSAIAGAMQSNPYVSSITQGMMGTLPVLVAGSIINLIANLPIPAWQTLLTNIGIYGLLQEVVKIFQLIGLFIAFGIGRSLAEKKEIDGVYGGLIAMISYLLVIPYGVNEGGDFVLTTTYIGSQGIITAMIVSLLSVTIFAWVIKKNWVLKMPDSVPPAVANGFKMIPPALLAAIPFIALRGIIAATPFGSLPDMISGLIAAPLQNLGNTLGGHMIMLFLNSFLWWLGIHNMALFPIILMVFYPAGVANITAAASGQPIPNMLSWQSMLIPFQFLGGPGCLLGLFIDMLLFSKSERYKAQAKISAVPGFFNIIEPTMFGLPIVMNTTILLPFILVPQVVQVLMYLCLKVGIFTTPIVDVNMFVPGPIAGFLMGGGAMLGVFMILMVLLSAVIYFPFVKAMDAQELKNEMNA